MKVLSSSTLMAASPESGTKSVTNMARISRKTGKTTIPDVMNALQTFASRGRQTILEARSTGSESTEKTEKKALEKTRLSNLEKRRKGTTATSQEQLLLLSEPKGNFGIRWRLSIIRRKRRCRKLMP